MRFEDIHNTVTSWKERCHVPMISFEDIDEQGGPVTRHIGGKTAKRLGPLFALETKPKSLLLLYRDPRFKGLPVAMNIQKSGWNPHRAVGMTSLTEDMMTTFQYNDTTGKLGLTSSLTSPVINSAGEHMQAFLRHVDLETKAAGTCRKETT